MKKTTILKHWPSYAALARDLEITRSAISQWPDPIPEQWARYIALLIKHSTSANRK